MAKNWGGLRVKSKGRANESKSSHWLLLLQAAATALLSAIVVDFQLGKQQAFEVAQQKSSQAFQNEQVENARQQELFALKIHLQEDVVKLFVKVSSLRQDIAFKSLLQTVYITFESAVDTNELHRNLNSYRDAIDEYGTAMMELRAKLSIVSMYFGKDISGKSRNFQNEAATNLYLIDVSKIEAEIVSMKKQKRSANDAIKMVSKLLKETMTSDRFAPLINEVLTGIFEHNADAAKAAFARAGGLPSKPMK